MNCDDLFAMLETGSWLARRKARRHLGRCRRCAAAYSAFLEMKRQLAATEPISTRDRKAWVTLAQGEGESRETRIARLRWTPLATMLAAACIASILMISLGRRDTSHTVPTPAPNDAVVVDNLDTSEQWSRLSQAVDRLDARIVQLKEQARRLEAQMAVTMIMDRYGRW